MKYLITGAGFANKGAESMLYQTISEIKKKDKFSEITVLCLHGFHQINPDDFDHITFLEESEYLRRFFLKHSSYLFLKRLFYTLVGNKEKLKKYNFPNIYKACDVILDISGYALSSQWGGELISVC